MNKNQFVKILDDLLTRAASARLTTFNGHTIVKRSDGYFEVMYGDVLVYTDLYLYSTSIAVLDRYLAGDMAEVNTILRLDRLYEKNVIDMHYHREAKQWILPT